MTPTLKEAILVIIFPVLSITAFWLWKKQIFIIIDGEFRDYLNFTLPLAGLIIAGSVFLLLGFFVKNKWAAYAASLIGISAPYLFIPATPVVFGTLILSMLLTFFALHRLRKEYAISLGFSISKIAKAGLPIYLTVASLIISIFYLARIDERQAIASFLPKAAFNWVLENQGKALTEQLGIPPELSRENSQESTELFYQAVTNSVEKLLGPYQKYLPFAAAAAFFLAFRTLSIPLYYAAIIITFLLIKFMLWSKILKREIEEMQVEKITL